MTNKAVTIMVLTTIKSHLDKASITSQKREFYL